MIPLTDHKWSDIRTLRIVQSDLGVEIPLHRYFLEALTHRGELFDVGNYETCGEALKAKCAFIEQCRSNERKGD